ncbi:MAG TPA: redoxin domain-containing protein [Gemmatimonadales bacterium]|nr:redoxin domain-containing protein [Gemmatimonadales bacterium]
MRFSHMIAAGALLLAAGMAPSNAAAQQAETPAGPKVGDMAPDFTITGVTRHGTLRDPVRLSDYRGQTVVLAFFPRARTSGCTVQMESYRDRYQEVFNGGQGVTLLAVSVDPDTALLSWARDANFPMLFGSDVGGAVGTKYGAFRGQSDDRSLFVIDPEGRISYVARPFRQMAEDAYAELAAAVDAVTPARANELQ